jgi:fructoselysine 6-kinase
MAVVGDACIDTYEDRAGASSAVGGNALNVAVNLREHGVHSALFCVVGDDRHGDCITAALDEKGVDSRGVRRAKGASWVTFVRRGDDGTVRVQSEDAGVATAYAPTAEDLDLLARFDHVHVAGLVKPATTLTELGERGVPLSCDFGESSSMPAHLRGIAFFSQPTNDREAGNRTARRAVERGAELAVVTLGENGSVAADRTRCLDVPTTLIRPVDTLGAGDSYIAAFLAAIAANISVDEAMRVASEFASRACLHWAAWPQEPLPIDFSASARAG